jgi:hypothetical protein
MLPLLLIVSWFTVVMAVVALCRASARAEAASAAELPRAKRMSRSTCLPGVTVWEHSDRIRLEHSRVAVKRQRRPGAHRSQRRPAACA